MQHIPLGTDEGTTSQENFTRGAAMADHLAEMAVVEFVETVEHKYVQMFHKRLR